MQYAPEGGITVYKVLFRTRGGVCFTPHMNVHVKLGCPQRSSCSSIYAIGSRRVGREGVHAYRMMDNAVKLCESLHRSELEDVFGDIQMGYGHFYGRYIVVESVIPEFTPYYVSLCGTEIASQVLMIGENVVYVSGTSD